MPTHATHNDSIAWLQVSVEIETAQGHKGLGFSYSKRARLSLAKLLGSYNA